MCTRRVDLLFHLVHMSPHPCMPSAFHGVLTPVDLFIFYFLSVCLGGVVLDLMRMKKFKFHESEMQAQVEPGIKKSELNDQLAKFGFMFGPDPASNPS